MCESTAVAGWSSLILDATTGKRKQRWHSGYRTRKDAEKARTDVLGRLDGGTYVEPTRQTLALYLRDQWLPAIRDTVRPTTLRSYEMHTERHVLPHLGSVLLQKLTGAMLNDLYATLREGGGANGRPLSPATVRRVHAMFHRSLRDAVRWNMLTRNPADAADPPKQRADAARDMTTWTPQDAQRFLEHIGQDRVAALWRLLLLTGMRRGEALGLRWADVDLDAERVAIRQTLVAVGYEVRVSTPKTAKGRRVVALDAGTVAALRSHRARQVKERLAMGEHYQDTGLVFTRHDGTHVHPDRASKMFDAHVRRAGLPRIRLHDLRHTHATLLASSGAHPKVVQERLGHSDVALTLNVYSHAFPAMHEEAADSVAQLLG